METSAYRTALHLEYLEARLNLTPPVPAYNSLLGAVQALYLDFDGNFEPVWGGSTNVTTLTLDSDGNPNTFNSSELALIEETWKRVAEDFAPFKINVTTVEPPSFADGVAMRVAIGVTSGTNWPYGGAGGVAYLDSFTNSISNVCYVLPQNLGPYHGKYVALASSHEAGHTFGLWHQSTYSGTQKTNEYHPGTADWGPLMGAPWDSIRDTWHDGPDNNCWNCYQDDMALISRPQNVFGYRVDDYSDTFGAAKRLRVLGNQLTVAGIIMQPTDTDMFVFATPATNVTLTAVVFAPGPNLDAKLELYKEVAGVPTLIGTADPSNNLNVTISMSLTSGKYFVAVKSHGGYGEVGQFTLNGMFTSPGAPAPDVDQAVTDGQSPTDSSGERFTPPPLIGLAISSESSALVTADQRSSPAARNITASPPQAEIPSTQESLPAASYSAPPEVTRIIRRIATNPAVEAIWDEMLSASL